MAKLATKASRVKGDTGKNPQNDGVDFGVEITLSIVYKKTTHQQTA